MTFGIKELQRLGFGLHHFRELRDLGQTSEPPSLRTSGPTAQGGLRVPVAHRCSPWEAVPHTVAVTHLGPLRECGGRGDRKAAADPVGGGRRWRGECRPV